jgi:hypothetical protein
VKRDLTTIQRGVIHVLANASLRGDPFPRTKLRHNLLNVTNQQFWVNVLGLANLPTLCLIIDTATLAAPKVTIRAFN